MNLLRWKPRLFRRSGEGAEAEVTRGSRTGPHGAGAQDAAAVQGAATELGRAGGSDHRQAIRRTAFLALTLAAVALSVRAVIGERGLLATHRSHAELARLDAVVEKWRQRNAFLETRIKALREDPATIERIARERLDWVRPGEITFLFPYDSTKPEPGDPGPVAPGEFSPAQSEDQPR